MDPGRFVSVGLWCGVEDGSLLPRVYFACGRTFRALGSPRGSLPLRLLASRLFMDPLPSPFFLRWGKQKWTRDQWHDREVHSFFRLTGRTETLSAGTAQSSHPGRSPNPMP